jgi:hypothetical protein
MSNAAEAVRPMSTEDVLRNHLRSARLGVDAVMDDYTNQSMLMTHDATYRGLAEIRLFFTALFESLPAGFFEAMRMRREEVDGDFAYIVWDREPIISRATDTFVVRDGKILFQTFTSLTD